MLAAGRSSRFASANKLVVPFRGRPVALHAAKALSSVDFGCRIVVCSRPLPVDWTGLGFEELPVAAGGTMSASIAAGVARLRTTDLGACLIALADMPFVPPSHFRALVAHETTAVLATSRDGRKMVPARFTRGLWDELEALSGDNGARELLQAAPAIEVPARWLADIDTREDLERLAQREAGE